MNPDHLAVVIDAAQKSANCAFEETVAGGFCNTHHCYSDSRHETRSECDFIANIAESAARAAVDLAAASIRAEALRDYAAELDWKQPEAPCADPEPCCGSAASCDAMQPSVRVVGASSLRERADREERL